VPDRAVHISEALVRWIAPILAFTADELWQYLPGERNESVMLTLVRRPDRTAGRHRAGSRLLGSRHGGEGRGQQGDGNPARGQAIGGNLQAEVTLFAEEALSADLAKLGNELRFVLITSTASVVPLPRRRPSGSHRSRGPEAEGGQVGHPVRPLLALPRRRRQPPGAPGNLRPLRRQHDGAGEVRHHA
jgi:isoleucyl-tRNA synthetase